MQYRPLWWAAAVLCPPATALVLLRRGSSVCVIVASSDCCLRVFKQYAHAISWLISIRHYLLTSFYAPPLFSLSTGFGYVMMLFMSLEYLHRNQYWTTVHFRNKWLCCLSTVVLLLFLCILTGMIVIRLILSSSKMSRVLSVTPSSLLRLLLLWGPASGRLARMCSSPLRRWDCFCSGDLPRRLARMCSSPLRRSRPASTAAVLELHFVPLRSYSGSFVHAFFFFSWFGPLFC